jgi:hypothetical protein
MDSESLASSTAIEQLRLRQLRFYHLFLLYRFSCLCFSENHPHASEHQAMTKGKICATDHPP